jgi:hypothetical protein
MLPLFLSIYLFLSFSFSFFFSLSLSPCLFLSFSLCVSLYLALSLPLPLSLSLSLSLFLTYLLSLSPSFSFFYRLSLFVCLSFLLSLADAAAAAAAVAVWQFICKEFWIFVFGKQVDKLQTNYKVIFLTLMRVTYFFNLKLSQGTYVLHDKQFKWFSKISSANLSAELYLPYTWLTAGSSIVFVFEANLSLR